MSSEARVVTDVLTKLGTKFNENLQKATKAADTTATKADLFARAIAEMGEILREDTQLPAAQKEIATIPDEVFADMVLSLYFGACGLDSPAHSVLRRALELGIAVVYLWDLPHCFWGWKSHDADLIFGDMVDHLAKPQYKSYVASLNSSYQLRDIFEYSEARRLYRLLSNTVHGKISTHAAQLPNRFQFDTNSWHSHCALVNRVGAVILDSFRSRFFHSGPELLKRLPAVATL